MSEDGRRVVVATGNRGKLRELDALLGRHRIEFAAGVDMGVPEVEETGQTFVENAILKARAGAIHTGLPCIADDSGLVVDALNGAPGIYSSRYAGADATDQTNLEKLLRALHDVVPAERSARFQCVLVYLRHAQDPSPIICEGTWEGRIARSPRGSGGFGYDPVFVPAGLDCTSAELPADDKNRRSHRGQALSRLAARLERERG